MLADVGTIALTVLVVVGFTTLLTWLSWRKRNEAWEGTVTEIRRRQINRNSGEKVAVYEERMVVRYRTDTGTKGKFTLPPQALDQRYPGLKTGDRLVKRAGQYLPDRG